MTTSLESCELRDESAGAVALLAAARGGMVTRFEVAGQPILYLDEATLTDESKNVRGGNPVLFPSPGQLTEGRFSWRGRAGAMKQHGFARSRPWRAVSAGKKEVTLELVSDEITRAQFPWDFALRYRHVLAGAKLRIEQRIENRSGDAMPFAAGFHPYFFVRDSEKGRARIPTGATRAYDNVAKREVDVAGPIDLTHAEVDLHLCDHGGAVAALELPDGRRIIVRASPEYTRWVIWTLAGKDFVCLEPWTAAGDALNRDEGPIVVPPGGAHDMFVEFEVT